MHYSLNPAELTAIRTVDSRLVSYNIEMTEITGGTFWKEYTPEQIAGTQPFPKIDGLTEDFTAIAGLMQHYPSVNLNNETLRTYAKALGPAWIRVSGSWATKTYYDFDGRTGGKIPKGYNAILTREQWAGVLDFVKAVDGKLLVSVSNCAGDHPDGGALNLTQARRLFTFSHDYGVDISAAEFMNEPNMLTLSGAPRGYTAMGFARDQDIFNAWVRSNYPDCLLVGPCTTGDPSVYAAGDRSMGAGIGSMMTAATTDALMAGCEVPLDVFSYHYYNGISERLAPLLPPVHWFAEEAHTDAYLDVAVSCARKHLALRDKYVPGGQMWVTESGDAAGGGDTWASTYLDVLRTLNELGSFSTVTDGVIFHNTLASSDYGLLQHGTFEPRPNYYAVLLWNRLMGSTVYRANPSRHIYCHSRKDGKAGYAYLVINNSLTDTMTVALPTDAVTYTLSGGSDLRSRRMFLNGEPLLADRGVLPAVDGLPQRAGDFSVAPGCCTFLVI